MLNVYIAYWSYGCRTHQILSMLKNFCVGPAYSSVSRRTHNKYNECQTCHERVENARRRIRTYIQISKIRWAHVRQCDSNFDESSCHQRWRMAMVQRSHVGWPPDNVRHALAIRCVRSGFVRWTLRNRYLYASYALEKKIFWLTTWAFGERISTFPDFEGKIYALGIR